MLSGSWKDNQKILISVIALISFGVLLRLIPHPANFAPITAIALIGGAVLKGHWAWFLPLATMITSDAIIGFHNTILFTWGSFLIIGILSARVLSSRLKLDNVLISAMAASVFFYVVTNFGVWFSGGLYEHTMSGLLLSYQNGLPFFRNTFMGDIFFSISLFYAYQLATSLVHLPKAVFKNRRLVSSSDI